jgi:hypothetical protein
LLGRVFAPAGLPLSINSPQWAFSSLFIGDSNGTHQSAFDDFDEKRRLGRAVFAYLFFLAQVSQSRLQLRRSVPLKLPVWPAAPVCLAASRQDSSGKVTVR